MAGWLAKFLRISTVITFTGVVGGGIGRLTSKFKSKEIKLPIIQEKTEINTEKIETQEVKVTQEPEAKSQAEGTIQKGTYSSLPPSCQRLRRITGRVSKNENFCKKRLSVHSIEVK